MSNTSKPQCQATTKAGTQCKNRAQPGASYCHIHQTQETAPPKEAPAAAPEGVAPEGITPAKVTSGPEFRQLVAELNDLAEELRGILPDFSPPPFSQEGLLRLLRDNIDRMTPEMRLGLLRDLQEGLQDTSPRDFFDPDTWKGIWYLLNYSLQTEAAALKEKLAGRLAGLPGAAMISDMPAMLEGASARDLLELETWKGMWYLLTYSVQAQVEEVRKRVRGEEA